MEILKQRFYILTVSNESGTYHAYCEDDEIKPGDLVIVETFAKPFLVIAGDYYGLEDLDIPLEDMLKVKEAAKKEEVSSKALNTISEISEEERAKQEEDDSEESLEEEEEEALSESGESIEESIDETMLEIEISLDESFSLISYETDLTMRIKDKNITRNNEKTGYEFVRDFRIKNHSESALRGLKLAFHFSSSALFCEDLPLPTIDYQEDAILRFPFIKVDKEKLFTLDSPSPTTLSITLLSPKGRVLSLKQASFILLPIGEVNHMVSYDYRLYAKFVTPEAEKIRQFTLLSASYSGKGAFSAYLSPSWNERAEEIGAVYNALVGEKILYQTPPAKTAKYQKVRLPSQVLLDHKGTCLDLSLLLCSCLEEIGYHPLLIVLDGHALVGVFLEEKDSFENARCSKVGAIYNRATGKRDILLIDAVDITDSISFKRAIEDGIFRLNKYDGRDFMAIDVSSAHKSIFLPLLTKSNAELDPSYLYRKVVEEEFEPIIEHKYHEIRHEANKDRFTFWENKLLDLTEKNPLVSFKFSPSNFVVVLKKNLAETLYKEEPLPLNFIESSTDKKHEELIDAAFSRGFASLPVGVDPNAGYLLGRLRSFKGMLSKNQSEMEETGAATLYLCMGLLTYDSEDSKRRKKKGYAPFMLLPVKIERKGYNSSAYIMVYDYDNAMVNKTFFEYYKSSHEGFDISPLYNDSSGGADRYDDLVMTFKDQVQEDISLDENCFFIANLTFAHYIMWTDMTQRKEELRKNPIVASIVSGNSLLDPAGLNIDRIEENENYRDFAAPLPYDSTQLSAILEAGEGKSFILDGPPGTGKSQTIVNIIVNAIYHNKTVLFVAEKKAALDVVADRLRKIKLDRFCMELHSTKANKKDFFGRLNESMRLGPTSGEGGFGETVDSLEAQREAIMAQVKAMHEAADYCLSFFEAITLELNLQGKIRPFPYPKELVKSTSRDDYFASVAFLNSFIGKVSSFSNIETSSLWKTNLTFFSHNNLEQGAKDFGDLKEAILSFLSAYSTLNERSGLSLALSAKNIKGVLKAYDLCFNGNLFRDQAQMYLNLPSLDEFSPFFTKANRLHEIRLELGKSYDLPSLQLLSLAEAIEVLETPKLGFLKRAKYEGFARKTLQKAAKIGKKVSNKGLLEEMKKIVDYQELYNDVRDYSRLIDPFLPFSFMSKIDEPESIIASFKATFEFISEIKNLELLPGGENALSYFLNVLATEDITLKLRYGAAIEALKELQQKETAFFEKYALTQDSFSSNGSLPLDSLLTFLEEGSEVSGISKLVYIASCNEDIHHSATPLTLPILMAFKRGEIALKDLSLAFEEAFAKEIIRLYFDSNRLINDFHSSIFDNELSKYRELISDYSRLIIEEVTSRATKGLIHGKLTYKDSSPIGKLKTIASSGGRGMTIRQALDKFDSIIHSYFPVFLMSPLSAAQYLSVEGKERELFDLVIFDEASQIPVHEAVGPIARGKSLIVAGDPKQMPPTTYFTTEQTLSIDELEYQDASSLLDECIAISFPQIRLCYHYRSRHESLIDFSNKNFYDDELHTFPAPSKGNRAIRFEKVPLKTAKSDSRISAEEITAILSRLNIIYSTPENAAKSLGIIVFNLKQKESLEKALETYLEKEKKLASAIAKAEEASGEPLFIKSIENVQGDERDIIMLCIGFRKSLAGRAVVTGPLAISGGERRLNVAISRSKEAMYVISTITDDDFDSDSYIASKGALLLKHFLSYAKSEDEFISKRGEAKEGKKLSIADFLRKDLEREGFLCDMGVGESKNKVDIAIRGESLNNYVLGILIDDDEEVSSATLRDKEYVEPSVLNHLNWKIIKVYAVSYYKNKDAVIERIKAALDKPFVKMEERIDPILQSREIDTSYLSYDYVKVDMATLDPMSYAPDKGFSYEIRGNIRRIIEVEGPISFSLIRSRIKEKIGLMAFSPLATLFLENELRAFKESKDEDGFYWPPNSLEKMPAFRIGGDRDIAEIPYEEFECAFNQILARQGSLSQEDLFKATLEAFAYGSGKLTKKNREFLIGIHKRYLEAK